MSINREHVVRIIGGKYKGKLLPVIDALGLRPTPDRIRETVFCWIGDKINNAKVLDLFAGSGALGIESISRGAKSVVLIELNGNNYNNLQKVTQELSADIKVIKADALNYLESCKERFDIVFMDPPYNSNLRAKALNLLKQKEILKPNSLVYVEMRSGDNDSVAGYRVIKSGLAGQVKFTLWQLSNLDF